MIVLWFGVFFFFKQKTAYEMRISDWSSDVCSSDLNAFTIMVEGKWLHFRTDLDHYEHSLTLAPRILANYTPFTHTYHQPLHVATSTARAIILSCNNLIKCTTPPPVV